MKILKKMDLLYPDLSYKIVGILFDIDNELGYGYKEKYYEQAVSIALENANIRYET